MKTEKCSKISNVSNDLGILSFPLKFQIVPKYLAKKKEIKLSSFLVVFRKIFVALLSHIFEIWFFFFDFQKHFETVTETNENWKMFKYSKCIKWSRYSIVSVKASNRHEMLSQKKTIELSSFLVVFRKNFAAVLSHIFEIWFFFLDF
jgi:hypothetical protein